MNNFDILFHVLNCVTKGRNKPPRTKRKKDPKF